MKVLIIGKNGQVGYELEQFCISNKIDYVATDRSQLNITDHVAVSAFFTNQHDFDVVINAAAYTAVDKAESEKELANAVNHLAVKRIAEYCKEYNIPVIHISTDYVFNGEKTTNYNEHDLVNPLGVYGKTKLAGENALKDTWKKHIILRVSWVFGRNGNNFVKTMAKLSLQKEELGIVADQYGSPTSAINIANAIMQICSQIIINKQGQWGIYHFSGFPVTTWHQLAIASINEAKKQLFPVICKNIKAIRTEDYPTLTKRPSNSAFDTQKIQQVFSITQTSWQDDLADIIKQIKEDK